MRRHLKGKRKFSLSQFDYLEEDEYIIVSATTPASLASKVTSELKKNDSNEIPGGPSSGSHSHLLGTPFYARGKFHQSLMTTHWREVEHETSELAKQIQKLITAQPKGASTRELARATGRSAREVIRAVKELPGVSEHASFAERKWFTIRVRKNPKRQTSD